MPPGGPGLCAPASIGSLARSVRTDALVKQRIDGRAPSPGDGQRDGCGQQREPEFIAAVAHEQSITDMYCKYRNQHGERQHNSSWPHQHAEYQGKTAEEFRAAGK